MVLQAIKYQRGTLQILDQLKLPHAEVYQGITGTKDAWTAIKRMQVRGAPAIAIVAVLSLAVELEDKLTFGRLSPDLEEVKGFIDERLDYLVTSRPTAVNLTDAARKLRKAVKDESSQHDGSTSGSVAEIFIQTAERMLKDDIEDNLNIGKHGADWILQNTVLGKKEATVSVLTHCNTGSLATAGYGTALGIIRSLHSRSKLHYAYCTETRPYNQGARLTAYELVHDDIPAFLVTDSMAAALLQTKDPAKHIAAVVVGADRVAENGDTANKIGTYALAIIARYHGVRFLVAAPRTTIDINTKSGDDIIIEERPQNEMVEVTGPQVEGGVLDLENIRTVRIAAERIKTWNPAFDVTPAKLIDGIVTEVGVVEKGGDSFFSLGNLFRDAPLLGAKSNGERKPLPDALEGP